MADESVIPPSEASSVASVAAAVDGNKRKLEDSEANDAPGAVIESDESDAKRPRLGSNGDNVDEADASGDSNVPRNGHTEEKEEDEPKLLSEQAAEGQETGPDDNEKTDVASAKEEVKANEVTEEPPNIPKEGDVPVDNAERELHSDTQILSRNTEVPSDKVGVLIGKGGETIRSMQDNSGAKIQIVRDAVTDTRSTSMPLVLVGTLESVNRAERLIKGVIAEADAGGSPLLVARGFNIVQPASGGEQLEIPVPIDKAGLIIGKGGETIRNLQTRSGARIQLIQPNDGDQPREKMVRVTGNKKQIEIASDMIKDVMNQTMRPSPFSGGYNQQQGYRPRVPVVPQWGAWGSHHAQFSGYDYPHRGQYPSQSSRYPPPQAPGSNFGPSWEQRHPLSMHGPSLLGNYNYGQHPDPDYEHPYPYPPAPSQPYSPGYNEPKYGHTSSQTQHPGYGGPQEQYDKPPVYDLQAQAPHSQPYAQSYGQNMYRSPTPMQQSYPTSSAPAYPQSIGGYGPSGAQAVPAGGYGSYPSAQPGYAEHPSASNTTYGYQDPTEPAAYGGAAQAQAANPTSGGGQSGYAQPTLAQPTYDESGGYGNVPEAAHSRVWSARSYPQSGQQPIAGYGQPGAQQLPSAGYGSYPSAQPGYTEQPSSSNTTYGYQGPTEPAAYGGAAQAQEANPTSGGGQSGYAQPTPTQPTYDESGGYGKVPEAAAHPQYDSSQVYGAHR